LAKIFSKHIVCHSAQRQAYRCHANVFCNIEASLKGKVAPEKILILGAHYDSIIGNLASRKFVMDFKQVFPQEFPSYKFILPGINSSDHWSFWQFGFPAMMVTDTAALRHLDYHTKEDTPEKINYDRLALLALSFAQALAKF
jgi:hypothetical protein